MADAATEPPPQKIDRGALSALQSVIAQQSAEEPATVNPPSEILSFLFLGDQDNATNRRQLDHFGITHIVNATQNPLWGQHEGIQCLFLGVDDVEDAPIYQSFEQVHNFIDEAEVAGGKVLVHCAAGRSRSATLILAYLMRRKAEPMRLSEAFLYVKRRRHLVLPNVGFWAQLEQEELRLFGVQSDRPDVYKRSRRPSESGSQILNDYVQVSRHPNLESLEDCSYVVEAVSHGWPGALLSEQVLLAATQHLDPEARHLAVQLLAELVRSGKIAAQEVQQGFERFGQHLDLQEERIDNPRIDSHLAELVAEAQQRALLPVHICFC